MKIVRGDGLELKQVLIDRVEQQVFSKNVGITKIFRFEICEGLGFTAEYYPEFKLLFLVSAGPGIWLPVDSYESALTILKNLSGQPMLTKKALEYANRDIKDDADKLMPTNKTIAWKKRDKGDRPTCPGHPG